MHELRSRRWKGAFNTVLNDLRARHVSEPVELGRKVLSGYHHQWRIVAGWRIQADFGEPAPRRIDILIPENFPDTWPRIALVDRPDFLTWPHVERDGILCLLPNVAEMDADNPAGIVANLLGRGASLIQDLIAGPMVERDLKDEFLTYWRYDLTTLDGRVTSILRPEGPSREVSVWQGNRIKVIGETEDDVRTWMRNRFGEAATKRSRIERGAMVWLDTPMLPSEYPRNGRDLLDLAEAAGPEAVETLARIAVDRQDSIMTIIGADGRFGPGLVAVALPLPGKGRLPRAKCTDPINKGFRPKHLPTALLVKRTFGIEPVIRTDANRADAPWIHGRGQDPRTRRLIESTVTVLGCGSVGAPVAVTLAQAGVGHINLVDMEDLAWANVGRHPLGAASVGKNKAVELAAKLRADYPHATFTPFATNAETVIANPALLMASDVVVSTMGSWRAEGRLNDWHVREDRPLPIVYGWTEAHASAGHAVVIAKDGGCLRCGVSRTGVPTFRVSSWPEGGSGAMEEPACGAHYQAYGPIELGYINSLIAEAALDCLLDKPTTSTHRIFAARRSLMDRAGGSWSPEWIAAYPERGDGGFVVERPWPHRRCSHCLGAVAA